VFIRLRCLPDIPATHVIPNSIVGFFDILPFDHGNPDVLAETSNIEDATKWNKTCFATYMRWDKGWYNGDTLSEAREVN
jgi:hypothetical protein